MKSLSVFFIYQITKNWITALNIFSKEFYPIFGFYPALSTKKILNKYENLIFYQQCVYNINLNIIVCSFFSISILLFLISAGLKSKNFNWSALIQALTIIFSITFLLNIISLFILLYIQFLVAYLTNLGFKLNYNHMTHFYIYMLNFELDGYINIYGSFIIVFFYLNLIIIFSTNYFKKFFINSISFFYINFVILILNIIFTINSIFFFFFLYQILLLSLIFYFYLILKQFQFKYDFITIILKVFFLQFFILATSVSYLILWKKVYNINILYALEYYKIEKILLFLAFFIGFFLILILPIFKNLHRIRFDVTYYNLLVFLYSSIIKLSVYSFFLLAPNYGDTLCLIIFLFLVCILYFFLFKKR